VPEKKRCAPTWKAEIEALAGWLALRITRA
jgi:hypothetical protein